MPPPIALLFCTIFVIYLLRCERKMSPDVSFALWIPTLWMLAIMSKGLGVWFGTSADTPDAGSPLDRAFLSSLLVIALIIIFKRNLQLANAIRKNRWIIILIAYMFISILWSDYQFVSFKRWTRQFIAVVMAFFILTEQYPREAIMCILRRVTYITVPFSWLLVKYYPHFGVKYHPWSGGLMWVGVTTQKNSLGRLCVISSFFLIWTIIRRWKLDKEKLTKFPNNVDIFVLFLTAMLMKGPPGSYSATSTAILIVGLTFYYGLSWLNKRQIRLSAAVITVVMALLIIFGTVTPFHGGLPFFSDISSTFGRDQTLTGRTTIWADLVPIAMQRPLFGRGIGNFWNYRTRDIYSAAHNGYLDIVLHYGFFGVLIFSAFMLSACRKAQKVLLHDHGWGSLMICYLMMAAAHNIAESSIASFANQLTAVVLFLAVSAMAPMREPSGVPIPKRR